MDFLSAGSAPRLWTMVGSVFRQEMLLGGRRSRLYALRWTYVGWLVLQIFFLWVSYMILEMQHGFAVRGSGQSSALNPASAPGVVGGWFASAFIFQQMILLLMATPAFVAGAITDEKRRGTLQYLLTTSLDTRHIILGKMFGRVAQVGLLTLAGLPLFALMAGFGGVEPATLLIAVVVLLAPMFALSAATILASVLCRQTRDAVLLLYFLGLVGWLVVALVGGPLQYLDPMYALDPAWAPWPNIDWPELAVRLSVEVGAWGLLGCICLAVAVWQLRPVYIRELESPVIKPMWYHGERVPIGDDPVRWRERYVERLMPASFKAFLIPLLLLPYGLVYLVTPKSASGRAQRLSLWPGVVLTVLLTTTSSLFILWACLPPTATLPAVMQAVARLDLSRLRSMTPEGAEGYFLLQGLAVMLFGSFIVGIRCSGAITGERERQTWEAVLLTPMSAKQLVTGKLWGVMGACYWYLLAYAVPAVLLSALGGVGCLGWTALLLAVTVLAMYYMGAVGIWCSARSKTSWRSLLATMGMGYLFGLALYLLDAIPVSILTAIVNQSLYLIDKSAGTHLYNAANASGVASFFGSTTFTALSCIGLALIFIFLSRLFLGRAQRWIADRERTRHWHEEPVYRRARRAGGYQPRYYP
jgi:ABC-type transport system involved in multi-copper enzyme maturation permease subunit